MDRAAIMSVIYTFAPRSFRHFPRLSREGPKIPREGSSVTFSFYEKDKNNMAKKSDLRSQVSQRLIWDAMFSLLSEKPFDSVHVKDICERAQVNRSTFYNHFLDKYELLQFGLHEVILKEAGVSIEDGPLTEPPHPRLFKYVYEHQQFWKNVFMTPRGRDFIDETIIESSESFFREKTSAGPLGNTSNAHSGKAADPPAPIVARMYFGAVGNLTLWWLNEGCQTPIESLNQWIDSLWNFDSQL